MIGCFLLIRIQVLAYYTQMAIAAVERLLTPINADDSSKTAASAMIALLHGTNPPHPIYGSWTFAEVAKQRNVKIPQIHLLIGNRLTQFEGPAAAFAALSDATATALYDIYPKKIRVILLVLQNLYQQKKQFKKLLFCYTCRIQKKS